MVGTDASRTNVHDLAQPGSLQGGTQDPIEASGSLVGTEESGQFAVSLSQKTVRANEISGLDEARKIARVGIQ